MSGHHGWQTAPAEPLANANEVVARAVFQAVLLLVAIPGLLGWRRWAILVKSVEK